MNIKKFFLAFVFVLLLNFSASATEFTITSSASSADLYTVRTYSDDITSEDVTEIRLTAAPYKFTTIIDALSFANDPAAYLNVTLADGEAASFPEVSITLDKSDSTSTSIFGGEIKLSDYPNITKLEINMGGSEKTLYTPSSATRHFTFDSSATVSMKNLILYGSSGNGGISISNGTVTLETVKFQNINLSGANGGAIEISGGSNHSFTDCEFTDNHAYNGGAVYISNGSTISFGGTNTFTNNSADVNGGAAYIGGGSGISFSGTNTFSSNYAVTNGGAVLLSASSVTLTFEGSTFDSNHAANGGAIIVGRGGGSLTVTDSTFTNNRADLYGGVLYTSGGSTFTFAGSSSQNTFQNNTAGADGGAFYINGGNSLVFSGTNEFDGNTAGTNGGAIAINASLSPSFSGVTFNNNKAANGGAVYISAGDATFSGETVFSNHTGITNGGALYLASSGTITISNDVTFSSNSATNGGLIYATAGTVNLYCDLNGSSSATNGGALYIDGTSVNVNVYGSVNNNTATGAGGAAYIASGTVNIANSSGSSTIENNSAPEGGAIYLGASRQAKLNISGSEAVTFTNNTADTNGGAIYAGLNSQLSFTPQVTFDNNIASEGNGGALWLAAASQLPKGTIIFNENSARRADGSTDNELGNGGAVYIDSQSTGSFTLNSSYAYTFTNNEAYVYGGAIYTVSSDIIFDGFVIDTKNTAQVGGGFASSGSGKITLRNSSSISNQSAAEGGAIYANDVVVNNSYMTSNTASSGSGGAIYAVTSIVVESSDFSSNISEGSETSHGGGAICSQGDLTVNTSYFYANQANKHGAAIFVNVATTSSSTVDTSISDSYFNENIINLNGNGGAVSLLNTRASTITGNTFYNNESKNDGGALYAQGNILTVQTCYFNGNVASRRGGAIYFDQSSSDPSASFAMTDSMFHENKANGGYGGAAYIATNTVDIKRCTFDENFVAATSTEGYGGALYINTTINSSTTDNNNIENCVFVGNSIENGRSEYCGGGAITLVCEETVVRSCTITGNNSDYCGGGIYVKDGKLIISGTIVLGNTDEGVYDIWVDGNIDSKGYNRIGVYGQGGGGSGVTDLYSVSPNNTDSTSYPDKTWMTRRDMFFGSNELDVNERTDLGSNIPPYIGSTRAGQVRLLSLMLSEDASLPETDRATNAIPYSRRQNFPAVDIRGVNRRNPDIQIDIGAVFFDGTRPDSGSGTNTGYSISYIQISGVPNEIRTVGQTVGLIAKIYYTNGRYAYGGTGENDEEVVWSASPSGYLRVNSSTGVITALRVTQGTTYVTLSVRTVRTNLAGDYVSASVRIKITDDENTGGNNNNLNVSPYSTNSDVVALIRDLRQNFEEYNMGYGLLNSSYSTSAVTSSVFQLAFSDVWSVSSAALVSNLEENAPVYDYPTEYSASDSYSASKGAGINVNLAGVNAGDIFPLTYPWNLSGSELQTALGSELYNEIASDLSAAYASDTPLNYSTVEKIFSALRIEFQGKNSSWLIFSDNSTVNLMDAMNCGAIVVEAADNGKGILIKLNAYIANVNTSKAGTASVAVFDGPQLVGDVGERLLVIPDGVEDAEIYGTMWLAQKNSSSSTSTQSQTATTNTNTQSQNSSSSSSSSSSGSGGGGCNSTGLGLAAAVLLLMKKRK